MDWNRHGPLVFWVGGTGFGVGGLGFRVEGVGIGGNQCLGFGFWGLGVGVRSSELTSRVHGQGLKVEGL